MPDTDKVSYDQDPTKWIGLHNAALGNLITAIKQLKRLSFSDADISGSLEVLLEKQEKLRRGE